MLLDKVQVDKREVCVGEDVLVAAVLKPDARADEVSINGARANPAVVHFTEPGERALHVNAYGAAVDSMVETVRVVDCPDRPQIVLGKRPGRVPKEVVVTALLERGLEAPVRYEWDFGDGIVVRDAGKQAAHVYAVDMKPDGAAQFLITARAVDAHGVAATQRMHYRFRTDPRLDVTPEEREAELQPAAWRPRVDPAPVSEVLAPEDTQVAPTPQSR